jgi:D-alanyl-D-alanine carboxypeptidase (penicillin-binding protein 5/6)
MKWLILAISIFIPAIIISILTKSPTPENPTAPVIKTVLTPGAEPSIPATISAQAAIIINASSGAVIAAKNPDIRLMPASTTKMMTAYIALKTYSPEEIITINRSQDAIGKSTNFTLGEQYLVIDILNAALINSGNDAALSLADHYPGGYSAFVDQMNLQALKWGLKNTHFTNVSGVEEVNHYSSARDLAIIANRFMQQPELREIVGKSSATINSIDGKYTHTFKNTNQLLGQIPGLIGIKTGWTDNAGECLVTYVQGNPDRIFVVLNSKDRFQDTKTLIEQPLDL